jgi:hypothetical protein
MFSSLLDHPTCYECAGQFYVNMHRRYEKGEYRPRGVATILAIVRFNISASCCSFATSLDTESVGEMCAKVFSQLIKEDRPHALHVAWPTFVVEDGIDLPTRVQSCSL